MKYGFGVDVGGTSIKLGLFQEDGTLLEKWEIPTRLADNGAHILPDIAHVLTDCLCSRQIARKDVLGIGIGVPGPVDEDGNVNKCVNLGWDVFNLHEALRALTNLPVKSGNDANVAALGEYWAGAGKGCKHMILVTLGTGIGGGIIIHGHLLEGAHGVGGEIGHITVNKAEPEACTCGKYGCVEQYASATGIVRTAKRCLKATHAPSMLRALPSLTCKDVFTCAAAGDHLAQDVLECTYAYLGQALADVCCVCDPKLVVLGGGVSKAGQPLLHGVHKYFTQNMFHACKTVTFSLAELGNDAGIYGCFKLVLDQFAV